ncbi:MAG: Chromosome partition protein Smc [Syntrophorhabdus sp. PtaU1.Bin153]|nr:MAG: Chromosome partition protein Smc [Syntrophorhabdus sp. PtaU1.Bin153]
MQSIKTPGFVVVLTALKACAEHLRREKKEEAKKTILAISGVIQFLADISQEKEKSYKYAQKVVAEELAEIIRSEGSLRAEITETTRSIEGLEKSIKQETVNKDALSGHISSLRQQLAESEAELRRHRAKLAELNDKSALSIIRSIFSFGLDRAIMGIAALIDNDAGRIRSLQQELAAYQKALSDDSEKIAGTEKTLGRLRETKESSEKLIAELKGRASDLHEHEKASRQKLVFFTEVALFYGKLLVMLQQIDHKIEDVADIVNELDDSAPTITDFDSSGGSLISLKQALEKFDDFLDREPVEMVPPAAIARIRTFTRASQPRGS